MSYSEAPAMGERRARLGYSAQDKVAARLILDALWDDRFETVRLADLEGGQVDDFVLIWSHEVWGNSVKWTGSDDPLTWADLCGAGVPLIRQLAEGWQTLSERWPGRRARVFLRTNRPISDSVHGNQLVPGVSLQRFLHTDWPARNNSAPNDPDLNSLPWSLLQSKSGLTPEAFLFFLRDCDIKVDGHEPEYINLSSADVDQWKREFNRLRHAINDRVADDAAQQEFSAGDIRRVINPGEPTRLRTHRFPEPEIGYEENTPAVMGLRDALSQFSGGYIALTGPAGAGKSTLVQNVIQDEPFGIPYFAFLPGKQGDPRDRGDALAFYRHIVTVLDQWDPIRWSHGIANLEQAKEVFSLHMARIRKRFRATGRSTIILVDGLDHVTREEGLDQPLQLELPLPAELEDGCIILISTQPQALHHLRPQIRSHIQDVRRNVEVTPLPIEAVHRCLAPDRLARFMSPEERSKIAAACTGNPLILTYIIKALTADLRVSVQNVVEQLGTFSGNIQDYYFERFQPLLEDPQTKRLLGLLCRLRGRTPLPWLQNWPEWANFETLHRLHLCAFFVIGDGKISFVHNSLVSYLRHATLPSLPGCDIQAAERGFSKELAARYPEGECVDVLSREHLYHLVMAGDDAAVLQTATLEWFRQGAAAFVPPSELLSLIRTCYRTALSADDWAAFLRLLASSKEIERRDATAEALTLARYFLDLDQPDRALEHIVEGVELRVNADDAMAFCNTLADYAHSSGQKFLMEKARQIFELAKPVDVLFAAGDEIVHRSYNTFDLLQSWAQAAPHFLSADQIVVMLSSMDPKRASNKSEQASEAGRAQLYQEALATLLECGCVDETSIIIAAIDQTQDMTSAFSARTTVIEYLQLRGDESRDKITELRSIIDLDSLPMDDCLIAGECLLRAGLPDEAKEMIADVLLPRPTSYPDNYGQSFRMRDFTFRIRIARLRSALGLPSLDLSPPDTQNDEEAARIAWVCDQMGRLLGKADAGTMPEQNLSEFFERLLTYHRRRIRFDTSWRYQYYANETRSHVYNTLTSVASVIGQEGGEALKKALLKVCHYPGPPIFTEAHRRRLATSLYDMGIMPSAEARDMVRGATGDAGAAETLERTESCFQIAIALHRFGDEPGSAEWVVRAGAAAHGIGSEKDYQMQTWIDWLDHSLTDAGDVLPKEVQLAARTLEVAGGDGGESAARHLVRICFRHHPLVGVRLGLEMIERGRIDLGGCLEATLEAAADAGAGAQLLGAIYGRLYLLIEPHPASKLGQKIVGQCRNDGEALEVALRCAQDVRVNCEPEKRLIAIRSLADGLRNRGLEPPDLTGRLSPSSDDGSSSGWVYKLRDGSVRSMASVSRMISQLDMENEWDHFPEENSYFAWERAISGAVVASVEHLSRIEQRTLGKGTHDALILAALAEQALKLGSRTEAERLAGRAHELAHDGSWFEQIDGAKKWKAYAALVLLDHDRWLPVARQDFKNEILQGRASSFYLLPEISSLFEFLEWPWPSEAALATLDTYLSGMTQGSVMAPPYESLSTNQEAWSPEAALCYLLVDLYTNPVASVASAARDVSVDYLLSGGKGLAQAFQKIGLQESIVLERALMVLNAGAKKDAHSIAEFQYFVAAASSSPSLAVRSLAYSLCEMAGWSAPSIATIELPPVYALALPEEPAIVSVMRQEGAEEIPGSGLGLPLILYYGIMERAARFSRVPFENILTRTRQFYRDVEQDYSWTRDNGSKLERWSGQVAASQYLRPRAFVAREAVMRALNELILAGRLDARLLSLYQAVVPAYDPDLESMRPQERPEKVVGIVGERHQSRWQDWVDAVDRQDLGNVLTRVNGLYILAEHSLFRRPEWKWPDEERITGMVPSAVPLLSIASPNDIMDCHHAMMYMEYKDESFFDDSGMQVVVRNIPREITTPASGWLALNPSIGRRLGWHLSDKGFFTWKDNEGAVMVESLWWRDGWTYLKPPYSFLTLGEGWLVTCTESAYISISRLLGQSRLICHCERSTSFDSDESNSNRVSRSAVTEHFY